MAEERPVPLCVRWPGRRHDSVILAVRDDAHARVNRPHDFADGGQPACKPETWPRRTSRRRSSSFGARRSGPPDSLPADSRKAPSPEMRWNKMPLRGRVSHPPRWSGESCCWAHLLHQPESERRQNQQRQPEHVRHPEGEKHRAAQRRGQRDPPPQSDNAAPHGQRDRPDQCAHSYSRHQEPSV